MWRDDMGFPIERTKACAAIGALLLFLATDGAWAQQPTPEQTSAIRGSCRSDFMANCSGVTPGGKDALDCLKRNLGKLSGSCKAAVSAVMPVAPAAAAPTSAPAAVAPAPAPAAPAMAPAPSATPKPAATPASKPTSKPVAVATPGYPPLGPIRPVLPRRALIVLEACRGDQQTLCAGIPPGGGRVLSCLAENGPGLSAECYKALAPLTQ
jgi:hypothetical protein